MDGIRHNTNNDIIYLIKLAAIKKMHWSVWREFGEKLGFFDTLSW